MSDRLHAIQIRGWIAIIFAFVALALPMVLNALGLANYEPERSESDPYRPADQSLGERICLVSEWMTPACVLAWAVAQFRVRNSSLFAEQTGRIVPLAFGMAGMALLITNWVRWAARPYSGEHFGFFQGWQFGLGWFLLWYSFIFVSFSGKRKNDSALPQRKHTF